MACDIVVITFKLCMSPRALFIGVVAGWLVVFAIILRTLLTSLGEGQGVPQKSGCRVFSDGCKGLRLGLGGPRLVCPFRCGVSACSSNKISHFINQCL